MEAVGRVSGDHKVNHDVMLMLNVMVRMLKFKDIDYPLRIDKMR